MQPIYIAVIATRSFDFTAVGLTDDLARDALMIGWKAHCSEEGRICDPDLFSRDEIRVAEISDGQCIRRRRSHRYMKATQRDSYEIHMQRRLLLLGAEYRKYPD